jgi:hypothetical protein
MASTASVKAQVAGDAEVRRDPASDADSAPQRLAGCDDLAPVIVAAVAAHMVRPLQLPAVGAFGVGLVRERLMAPPHPGPGGGGLSLRYGHLMRPLLKRRGLRDPWSRERSTFGQNASGGV